MILAFVALLFAGILGAAGLAVDVGHGYLVRAILNHAVDDGVRSGVRWSAQAQDTSGDGGAIIAAAVAAAQSVARADLAAQGLGRARATATLSGGHLTVSAEASAPTFFLSVFGLTHWTVRASADGWFIPTAAGTSIPAAVPFLSPTAVAPPAPALLVPESPREAPGSPPERAPEPPPSEAPEPPPSEGSPSPDPPSEEPCDCGGGGGGGAAEGG